MNFKRIPTHGWRSIGLLVVVVLATFAGSTVAATKGDEGEEPTKSGTQPAGKSDSRGEAGADADAEPIITNHVIEVEPGVFRAVKGKQGRRQARLARLVRSFQGGKRAVYMQYGFPSSRHRERDMSDRVTEYWHYHGQGLEFVFVGNRLVRSRQNSITTRLDGKPLRPTAIPSETAPAEMPERDHPPSKNEDPE